MSVANFPFRQVHYQASYAAITAVPATPVNQAVETSLVVLKDAGGVNEVVLALPSGMYTFNAKCIIHVADAETFAQQIDLQIVRLSAQVAGVVLDYVSTATFALNRLGYAGAAGVATFVAIANVDYNTQCSRADVRIPAGQFYGVRVGVNGNPVGGSTINAVVFEVIKTAEIDNYTTIIVAP